jgi:uncharacterized protein (TIGR01319 family)
MRWSAASTIVAAAAEGLLGQADLTEAAVRRSRDPGFLPGNDTERREDELIATAAVTLAMRRHTGRSQVVVGPEGRVVQRSGKDLREVGLLVGSGGVLRAAAPAVADRVLRSAVGAQADGWQLPERPRVVVDRDYVLAAVGLLADDHPEAARRLAARVSDTP